MVWLSYTAAMLIAISMKCAGAFIQSSGQSIQNNNSGRRNLTSSRTTQSPILHYSPSSAENAREEEIFSPYDDLFRSHLQHEQGGMAKSNASHHEIKNVHIILFNQGLQEEGIHCIEFPKNSGSNVILAFESYKDCQRFAKNLGSQNNIDSAPTAPQTQKIPTRNLNRYANELGMAVQVIPAGMNLKPPDRNCSGGMGNSGLMKLKEQKMYLDQLIGSSPSSSLGSAGDVGCLPAWG